MPAAAVQSERHAVPEPGTYWNKVGPNLQRLRLEQGTSREYYNLGHWERLQEFAATRDFAIQAKGPYCSEAHGPDCRECTTCHFCRQKTIDVKTRCDCEHSRDRRLIGGRHRGAWCGPCLAARMGEDIRDALRNPGWRCPCCRGICNCSGATCLRKSHGLGTTGQLVLEAKSLGYPSVAHYLILTHLRESMPEMPLLDAMAVGTRKPGVTAAAGGEAGGEEQPARKRARRDAADPVRLRQVRVQVQVAALMSEFALAAPPTAVFGGDPDDELGFSSLRSSLDDPDQDADEGLLPGLSAVLSAAAATPQASGQRNTSTATPPLTFGRQQHRGMQPAATAPAPARPDMCGMPPLASHARPPLREITPTDRSPAASSGAQVAPNRPSATSAAAAAVGCTAWGGTGGNAGRFTAHQQPRPQGGVGSGSGPAGSTRAGSAVAAGDLQPVLSDDRSRSIYGDDAYSGIQDQGTEGHDVSSAAAQFQQQLPGRGQSGNEGPHIGLPSFSGGGGGDVFNMGFTRRQKHASQQRLRQPPLHRAAPQQQAHQRQYPASAPAIGPHPGGSTAGRESGQQHDGDAIMHETEADSQEAAEAADAGMPAVDAAAVHHAIVQPEAPDAVPAQQQQQQQAAAADPQLQEVPRPQQELQPQAPQPRVVAAGAWGFAVQAANLRALQGGLAAAAGDAVAEAACRRAASACMRDMKRFISATVPEAVTICFLAGQPDSTGTDNGLDMQHAERPPLVSYEDLFAATEFFLLAAQLLPPEQLQWDVCPYLLLKEPLLDFWQSDASARTYAMGGMIGLLTQLERRGLPGPAAEVARDLMVWMGQLASECNALRQRLAARRRMLQHEWRQETTIGPLQAGANADDIETFVKGDQQLLHMILDHTLAAVRGLAPGCHLLLGPKLLRLLDSQLAVTSAIRQEALRVLHVAMLQATRVPAQASAAEAAARAALRERLTMLLQQDGGLGVLDALVAVSFPARGGSPPRTSTEHIGNGQPSFSSSFGAAGGSDGAPAGCQLVDVPEFIRVGTLATAHGLLVATGAAEWATAEAAAARPHTAASIWLSATVRERRFHLVFVDHVLRAAGDGAIRSRLEQISMLRCWLRAALDSTCRAAFADLTHQLRTASAFAFLPWSDVNLADLKADASGRSRAQLVWQVLAALMADAAWQSGIPDILTDFDEVAARLAAQQPAGRKRVAWCAAGAAVLAAVLSAGRRCLMQMRPRPSGPPQPLQPQLVLRAAEWAAASAAALQAAAAEAAAAKAAGRPDSVPREALLLDEVGHARQVVQAGAMQCLPAAVAALAGALPVGGLSSAPALHQALRSLLAAVLDVPLGGVSPLAVETAAAEEFVRALSPANHDPADRDAVTRMLEAAVAGLLRGALLAGLQAGSPPAAKRRAVSALRLVAALASETRLRFDAPLLRRLLPHLFKPLAIECLCRAQGAEGVQEAAAALIAALVVTTAEHCPGLGLVPPLTADPNEATGLGPTSFSALGPLQSGVPLDAARFAAAARALLQASLAGVVRAVRLAVAPAAAPAPEEDCGAADAQLFRVLGRPRPDEDARRLLADNNIAVSVGGADRGGPFRPGGFAFSLAETCVRLVAALAKVTPHGGDWAASILPALHRLLAAHRLQITSGLAAAYAEAVQALSDEELQERLALPSRAAAAPPRPVPRQPAGLSQSAPQQPAGPPAAAAQLAAPLSVDAAARLPEGAAASVAGLLASELRRPAPQGGRAAAGLLVAVLRGAGGTSVKVACFDKDGSAQRLASVIAQQPPGWQSAGGLRLTASNLKAWKALEPGKPRTLMSSAATQYTATAATSADRAAGQQPAAPAARSLGGTADSGGGGSSSGGGDGGGRGSAKRGADPRPVQAVPTRHRAAAVPAASVAASAPGPDAAAAAASQQGSHIPTQQRPTQPAAAPSAASGRPADPLPALKAADVGNDSQSTVPASQLPPQLPQTQQSQAQAPAQRRQHTQQQSEQQPQQRQQPAMPAAHQRGIQAAEATSTPGHLKLTMEMRKDVVRRLRELGASVSNSIAALKQAEGSRQWRSLEELLNHLGDELTRRTALGR